MHCPRCGQQQVSEETKFCSRCGFPLGLVSEILAHGGFLPQLAELYKSKKIITRRNGLIFSLFWFLILTVILTPLIAIIGGPEELVAIIALLGSVGGVLLLLASFLILKKEPTVYEKNNHELAGASPRHLPGTPPTALPAGQSQPAQSYVPPANSWKASPTGGLARPGSVTEGTTRLLQKEKDQI